ncbi:MAG TPA: hypothetical protein VD973_15275 [Symbiobacteriaceae bacterium]|nr:hypothetical protein [Symbiobacteriaceae bacterium]
MNGLEGRPAEFEATTRRTIWRKVLALLLGLFVLWFMLTVLVAVFRNLTTVPWFFTLLIGLIAPGGLMVGIALVLSPWNDIPIVRRVSEAVTAPIPWVIRRLEAVQILNWAVALFMLFYVIPIIGWRALELIGWAPVVSEKAYTYFSLVLASIVFTHWGGAITSKTTSKHRREQFPEVLALLRPKNIRVVVYGLMALAYVAANLEKFSGFWITNAAIWSNYKDVLVEVLLSYTAIDSVLGAWKERKEQVASHQ